MSVVSAIAGKRPPFAHEPANQLAREVLCVCRAAAVAENQHLRPAVERVVQDVDRLDHRLNRLPRGLLVQARCVAQDLR